MIETWDLTRRYGRITALDHLTVTIPAGAITALLGPNGAGKTTTLNLLTTLLEPSGGGARVAGHDVVEAPLEVRRVIGYVPEHGAVYEGLTAGEYLELAGRVHGLDPATLGRRRERFLAHFDLEGEEDRYLGEFSKGMRRKVLVAAALLHRPRVLFLDEPMDGLDVAGQHRLGELLTDFAAEGGTVVYSSHVLQQVEDLCRRLVLIHRGRLLWEGDVQELRDRHGGARLQEIFLRMTAEGDDGEVRWQDLLEEEA